MSDLVSREGRLREDPDFRRYWWSRVLSSGGTAVTLVALPVLVFRLSGSTVLTALVSGLEALPYLTFGLLAGVASDRLRRRAVMVAADIVDALLLGSIPVAAWLGILTVPQILVVAFAGPAVAVFFDGANFGALPVLVGRDRIAVANAAVWTASTVVELIAPALVGLALAVVQPSSLLLVDAVSFAASALLVRGIVRGLDGERDDDGDGERSSISMRSVRADVREGVAFVVRHPGVRTMTLVGTLQCLAGGGFVALMVVWCARVLDIGTSGWRFGAVFSVWSLGGILASAALPRLLSSISAARITLLALPIAAVFAVLTPLAGSWLLASVGLFCWSCGYTMVAVNSISYRQQVTPERLLGRVNTAGRMLSWGVGWTTGALCAGLLASVLGIREAMVALGLFEVVACVLAWMSPLRTGVDTDPGLGLRTARSQSACAP